MSAPTHLEAMAAKAERCLSTFDLHVGHEVCTLSCGKPLGHYGSHATHKEPQPGFATWPNLTPPVVEKTFDPFADMPLGDRIAKAIERVTSGSGLMRIPAEGTDPDLVLVACRERIASLEADRDAVVVKYTAAAELCDKLERECDRLRVDRDNAVETLKGERELAHTVELRLERTRDEALLDRDAAARQVLKLKAAHHEILERLTDLSTAITRRHERAKKGIAELANLVMSTAREP